jgi:oligopeptidase A
VVTLDAPSLLAVLRHADDPSLREKVYRAYVSRASAHGEGGDNAPTIEKILSLRKEQAALLGYESYAELSLAKKMATLDGAQALLEDLRSRSFETAQAEHAELERYAGRSLRHWDVQYYAEKLKKERYSFDEEETRQYLQLDAVLEGLFGVCDRLFGVQIAQVEPSSVGAQVWDKAVRVFEVRREGTPIGYYFLDPFARPAEKKGGAWMNGVIGRSRALAPSPGGVRLPVAILVCNQGEPTVDATTGEVTMPSLMTFDQCTTLFHETGHGLQHMLTNVREGAVSGISGVEWDAVEQPSQFMEYWVLEEQTLSSMARHWKTGERIPEELVKKVRAAKNYRAASGMLRQVLFSMTDLALHGPSYEPAPGSAQGVYRKTAETCAVRPPLEGDAFLCAFQHIFAGGYAAGYFSYKWAEVLSADGFAAFEEGGLTNEENVRGLGRLYADTVLGLGGSKPAAEVFELFRGRAPTATALLRHNDLL